MPVEPNFSLTPPPYPNSQPEPERKGGRGSKRQKKWIQRVFWRVFFDSNTCILDMYSACIQLVYSLCIRESCLNSIWNSICNARRLRLLASLHRINVFVSLEQNVPVQWCEEAKPTSIVHLLMIHIVFWLYLTSIWVVFYATTKLGSWVGLNTFRIHKSRIHVKYI